MSFHGFGFAGDDVCIPLPGWVAEIGQSNPDIFFTDGAGRRNPECLSWGIDNERVLRGRTATEVHFFPIFWAKCSSGTYHNLFSSNNPRVL